MGIGSFLPSVHKNGGWQSQYRRMIRWYEKFKNTQPGDFENPNIDGQHDILYACFQNIFFLKDWLACDALISNKVLNEYINQHLELQLCRDICNGTKHFNLNNPSVDGDFTIIREYEPFHKVWGHDRNKIIILSGGHKYELKALAWSCIGLWEKFITQHIPENKN